MPVVGRDFGHHRLMHVSEIFEDAGSNQRLNISRCRGVFLDRVDAAGKREPVVWLEAVAAPVTEKMALGHVLSVFGRDLVGEIVQLKRIQTSLCPISVN